MNRTDRSALAALAAVTALAGATAVFPELLPHGALALPLLGLVPPPDDGEGGGDAGGEPAGDVPGDAPGEAGDAPATVGEAIAQARASLEEGGEEAGDAGEPEEEGAEGGEEELTAEAGEEEPTGEAEAGEEEEPAEPEEGEEAAEEEEDAPEAEEEEEPADELEAEVIALNPRQPGDDPIEIRLDEEGFILPEDLTPEELAERLRQNVNEGMRGAEHRRRVAEIEAQQAELDAIGSALEQDPSGFMLEYVSPEHRIEVARDLLADEDVFEAVEDDLQRFMRSPQARETFQAKRDAERARRDRDRIKEIRTTREQANRGAEVATRIGSLIPDDVPDDVAIPAYKHAVARISEYIAETNNPDPSREEIEAHLRAHGFFRGFQFEPTPESDGSSSNGRDPSSPSAASEGRRVATRKAGERSPDPDKARRTGEELKQRSRKRKEATATTPAGAGAAAQRVKVPEGQGVTERIETLRKKGGLFDRG